MTAESNHRGASVVALVISLAALVLTIWMAFSARGSDDLYADVLSDTSVVASPPASEAGEWVATPPQAPQAAAAQAAPPASPPQSQR